MSRLRLMPVVRATCADYVALPDDGKRRELFDGAFSVVPTPLLIHQVVAGRLAITFTQQVGQRGGAFVFIGPLDVRLTQHDVVQPDVLVMARGRRRLLTKACVIGAPDLVVEVISPGRVNEDRLIKRALYEKHGVREYWLVDPETKSIEVLVLSRGRYSQHAVFRGRSIARSKAFPKIEVSRTALFAPI